MICWIHGCAGSRKTHRLIKSGMDHLYDNAATASLFITLVGSVTSEIVERIEENHKVPMHKWNNTNHYIGKFQQKYVCISNIDAFIHHYLSQHEDIDFRHGDQFMWKAQRLLQILSNDTTDIHPPTMKNDVVVSMILLDEAQDICHTKMNIILQIHQRFPSIHIVLVGDLLQSIFPSSFSVDYDKHPFLWIKDQCKTQSVYMNTTFRCPKEHVDVINILTRDFQQSLGVPLMECSSHREGVKPFFFHHADISTRRGSHYTSIQILNTVRQLMKHDPSIQPKDIAVITKKCNGNLLYEHLIGMQPPDIPMHHSKTRAWDGRHDSIPWGSIHNQMKLLSIHADKGKGHPVVFFIDFSHKSIPEERHLCDHDEKSLLSQSLLNVAITRSTKYLFIGMNQPSPYFLKHVHDLRKISTFVWEDTTCWMHPFFPTSPPFHDAVLQRSTPLLCPTRPTLQFNPSLIEDEDVASFQTCEWKTSLPIFRTKVPSVQTELLHPILKHDIRSIMEIVWLAHLFPKRLATALVPLQSIIDNHHITIVHDRSLMSTLHDAQMNSFLVRQKEQWFPRFHHIQSDVPDHPILFLPSGFNVDALRNGFYEIMLLQELSTSTILWWSLLWEDLFGQSCKLHNLYLTDFSGLWKSRLNSFIQQLRSSFHVFPFNEYKLFRFRPLFHFHITIRKEEELRRMGFDPEIDKEVFSDGYLFQILNRSTSFLLKDSQDQVVAVNMLSHSTLSDMSLRVFSLIHQTYLEKKIKKFLFWDLCHHNVHQLYCSSSNHNNMVLLQDVHNTMNHKWSIHPSLFSSSSLSEMTSSSGKNAFVIKSLSSSVCGNI